MTKLEKPYSIIENSREVGVKLNKDGLLGSAYDEMLIDKPNPPIMREDHIQ